MKICNVLYVFIFIDKRNCEYNYKPYQQNVSNESSFNCTANKTIQKIKKITLPQIQREFKKHDAITDLTTQQI